MRAIYVETLIHGDLDEIWRRTQDPTAHEQWDLRFTAIHDAPETTRHGARRLRYATRLLPGLTLRGVGVCTARRCWPDGGRMCALRFRRAHWLSIIGSGTGYWRYVPTGLGVRFLTRYDYQPAWGTAGRLIDLLLRPVMGWATAWSFDRLRLWVERGVSPRGSLHFALGEVAVRVSTVLVGAGLTPARSSAMVVLACAALLVPPLPTTPAARRCLRRPIAHRSRRARDVDL